MSDTASKPRDPFRGLSVYVIMSGPTPVAAVSIRHPASRKKYAFARVTWGYQPPVEGRGNGQNAFGINEASRACRDAGRKLPPELPETEPAEMRALYVDFVAALDPHRVKSKHMQRREYEHWDWTQYLGFSGFTVVQAL